MSERSREAVDPMSSDEQITLVEFFERFRNASDSDVDRLRSQDPLRNEWKGPKLWSETEVVRLQMHHLLGEERVEGCYDRSLIPYEVLETLKEEDAYEPLLRQWVDVTGMGGGMLLGFRDEYLVPKKPKGDTLEYANSVYAEMCSGIELTRACYDALGIDDHAKFVQVEPMDLVEARDQLQQVCEAQSKPGFSAPCIYEGAVLAPKGDNETVLAYATWVRSLFRDLQHREEQADASVSMAQEEIKGITFSNPNKKGFHLDQAVDTLMFDTLNGRVPGAAAYLFNQLAQRWSQMRYNNLMLWRSGDLELVDVDDELRITSTAETYTSQGNNLHSRGFFEKMGLDNVGNSTPGDVAIRYGPDGAKVYILRTRTHMCARLDKVIKHSNQVVARQRSRFAT